jgi:hypothetical protein
MEQGRPFIELRSTVMRESLRVSLAVFAAAVVAHGASSLQAQETREATPPPPQADGAVGSATTRPEAFVGLWDYNAFESINILTGRPEQAPRSATRGGGGGAVARGGGRPAGGGLPSAMSGGDGGGRGGGGRGGGGGSFGLGATPEMMREQRDMSRDLLEVPEHYSISFADGAITFVDDIERERSYPLNGTKRKYRLGAAEFNARLDWDGTQLRKDIEGNLGFRMSETYFLSPDGQRLFVIVRVGEPGRNRQQSGFNRVYDRVVAAPAGPAGPVTTASAN